MSRCLYINKRHAHVQTVKAQIRLVPQEQSGQVFTVILESTLSVKDLRLISMKKKSWTFLDQ